MADHAGAEHDGVLIAINPVLADRAEDFQAWLSSVVLPAVREHRPEQEGRWHVLRSNEVEDGARTFAFLFHGGTPEEWELRPLLVAALGADGADRALEEFSTMLRTEQYGWSFERVQL